VLAHGLVVFTIILTAISPIFSAYIAGALANVFECRLETGIVQPCIVSGLDLGGILYSLGVLGWLNLANSPSGLLVLVIYALGMGVYIFIERIFPGKQV